MIKNEELNQFKPGESGNPNGRPKGSRNLSTILAEMLDEEIEVNENGVKSKKKFSDVIIRKLIKKGYEGDIKAIQVIFDRTEGSAKQTIDLNLPNKPTIIDWSDGDKTNTETEGS